MRWSRSGVYLAFTIPVAVFPSTDFPRIVVGIDNGVAPIDQMQVTVTRPIEEAMNTVPGLDHVRSITSRGSAEVNLFFNWNVDMFQTLQYVNAALARVQTYLPANREADGEPADVRGVPDPGLQPDLRHDAADPLLGAGHVHHQAAAQPRRTACRWWWCKAARCPNFRSSPIPRSCGRRKSPCRAFWTRSSKSNLIDSPGLIENNHELVLALVSGQTRTPEEIANIVVKATPAGVPVRDRRYRRSECIGEPVYTIVTANGKPAVLLNIFRQPDSNTVAVADEVHREIDQIRSDAAAGRQGADRSTISPSWCGIRSRAFATPS